MYYLYFTDAEEGNEPETNESEEQKRRSRPSSTATTKPMTGTGEETKTDSNSKKNSAKSKNSEAEPEGVIEGVIDGEDEVEVLNQDGSGNAEDENIDVDVLIESGNMEKLAGLVLNGKGKLLEGKKSDNPELQAFLDNVPVYMVGKIDKPFIIAVFNYFSLFRKKSIGFTRQQGMEVCVIYKPRWIGANSL